MLAVLDLGADPTDGSSITAVSQLISSATGGEGTREAYSTADD